MNTYWVYENIKEQSSFYNKLDTLLLLSSVYLWKKHHPNFTTNLTVDKLTYDYLHNINATYLWDKVEILPKNTLEDLLQSYKHGHFKTDFIDTLIHEKTHVIQRFNQSRFDTFYKTYYKIILKKYNRT